MKSKTVLATISFIILTFTHLPADMVYQAEDAVVIYHGIIENEHTGFTGEGYVNLDNEVGSYLEWIISLADSGSQTATFFYATGVDQDRQMEIKVNNVVVEPALSFPPTGAWTTWSTQTITVTLDSGVNILRMTSTTSNGAPNLDKMELSGEAGNPYYKLNLEIIGEGSISCQPNDSLFIAGYEITLTAIAASGYTFRKWTGDTVATENPLNITIKQHTTIKAIFLRDDLSFPAGKLIGWASYSEGTTGGEGSSSVTVTNQSELESYASRSGSYIIQVVGTIEITPMGKEINVGSNKTIVGMGNDATLKGGGLGIKNVSNVIVRNLIFKDAFVDWEGKTTDNDAIEINNSHHVWINHCDLSHFDDGLIDIKNAADYVTISWCRFHNHNKVMLIGAGDDAIQDRGHLNTTVHHCWFDGSDGNGIGQRLPRVRFGKVHVFNNYYNDVLYSGVMSGFEGDIRLENCYFLNVPDPHSVVGDTSDNKLNASGNIFVNSSGRRDIEGIAFIPSDYYSYSLNDAADVPALVMANAGVQTITAIEATDNPTTGIPGSLWLEQNYPNPFNPATKISFTIPITSVVKLEIFNIVGTKVATLINQKLHTGQHQIDFNGTTLSSGVYLYRLSTTNQSIMKKMTLIK